ncbi:MAG: glycosyltransferase [Bacteroidales bacterium]|nr:glycosyltransferase [Bacteroidales bacterium]
MIPKILHYVWLGSAAFPDMVKECIASWHRHMPEGEWIYRLWNEQTIAEALGMASFDEAITLWPPYVREAWEVRKYAFVSDYVRLWALEREGGVYMDVDVFVHKSLEPLLYCHAFTGFEGSKSNPVLMAFFATEAHGAWIKEQEAYYQTRHFVKADGTYDLTPNTAYVSEKMRQHGFLMNGVEQDYLDLHVFPVDYFCPHQTTGEYLFTENTYCEHRGLASWNEGKSLKSKILKYLPTSVRVALIKCKRRIIG